MLLALELRKYGITVNCYAPGMIFTALSRCPKLSPFFDFASVNTITIAESEELRGRPMDEQTAERKKVSDLIVYGKR